MNYLEQLEKAVLFIEKNLQNDIKVDHAAAAAGYSYYHFHRVFEAALGESVGSYIRSRRLKRAADELLYTDRRILDIALDYQFDSQESFHRAFKKAFKISPGTYRKNRIDTIIGSKKELTSLTLRHLYEGVTIQPRILHLDPVCLIGFRGNSSLEKNRLPELWKIFRFRVEEIQNRKEGIHAYGVCEVNPDVDLCLFGVQTESNHFIGAEVSSVGEIPEGMELKNLPGGKYAVFTHKGKLDTLSMTYDYIWGTWVLCSGYELDLRDDFEYYNERFLGPDQASSELEICIPVK